MKTQSILLAICVLSSSAQAGQQTLAERVRRQHGAIEVHILREFSPVGLVELVRTCDLIARVVVLDNGRTLLSKDERSMYSEFDVQVLDQLFSREPLKPAEKIVVTKPGGTMTIEGHPVTSRESDFPPFHTNDEYILFLKLDQVTGQYLVPYGAQGAFRSIGGTIEQVSKDTGTWKDERGRIPISAFIQELMAILSSK